MTTEATTRSEQRVYRGPADIVAPLLSGLPGVYRARTGNELVLETDHFETDDRRLTAAGFALALRRLGADGEQPCWELELPDGKGRERLRVLIRPDDLPSPGVPDEFGHLIRVATRGRPLCPVARVRTVRTVTTLLDHDRNTLAELVHDQVTVWQPGRKKKAREIGAWTRAELNAAPGAPVEEIEARLVEAGMRPEQPSAESDLDRLLRPKPRDRRAGRPGSAGAVLVEYLAGQVDRLAAEELRLRRDGDDAVHQLRVAARRMRSALQSFRALLDREQIDPLIAGLRDFASALSPARDAEVLNERILTALDALPPELLLGPVRAQVTRHFARSESETGAAVLAELDGPRYEQLRTDLDLLLVRPPLTKRARRDAVTELPALVGRTARRLEHAVGVATNEQMPAGERELAMHDARKAAKRLRYATEVAAAVSGQEATRFAKVLKGVQTALGEHQDTVVAREALRELGAQAHAAGENGFTFGLLYGQDAALAASIEAQLPQLWAEVWTERNTRWLG